MQHIYIMNEIIHHSLSPFMIKMMQHNIQHMKISTLVHSSITPNNKISRKPILLVGIYNLDNSNHS